MRKAGWDTEAGRRMWLEGKRDSEIADAFGIKTCIVTTYRKRNWGNDPNAAGGGTSEGSEWPRSADDDGAPSPRKLPGTATGVLPKTTIKEMLVAGTGQDNPPVAACAAPAPFTQGGLAESEESQENIPQAAVSPLAAMTPVPTESIIGGGSAAHEREQSPDVSPAAARYSFDFSAGTRVPESAGTPAGSQDDAADTVEQKRLQMQPVTRINIMDVLAQTTEHLSGIRAVCTASAIQALWFWRNPEDLRLARNSIDYLLRQLEDPAYGK